MYAAVVYQGIPRRELLRFACRLCLQEKEVLLLEICANPQDPCPSVEVMVQRIIQKLEQSIRETSDWEGREAKCMALFHSAGQLCRALQAALDKICTAVRRHQTSLLDSILVTIFNQYCKAQMDSLDGFGQLSGAHVVKVRRRLEQMVRELKTKRGRPYNSPASLAADLVIEIRERQLTNLPTTPEAIIDYLYLIEADQARSDLELEDLNVIAQVVSSERLILLEQCLQRLSPELYQALALELGLSDEPAFISEESFKEYYGVGREAMRKRLYKAREALSDCLA